MPSTILQHLPHSPYNNTSPAVLHMIHLQGCKQYILPVKSCSHFTFIGVKDLKIDKLTGEDGRKGVVIAGITRVISARSFACRRGYS